MFKETQSGKITFSFTWECQASSLTGIQQRHKRTWRPREKTYSVMGQRLNCYCVETRALFETATTWRKYP